MGVSLLHYREWRGHFRGTWKSIWPIARTALGMIFRRKLFWALYALGLLIFFMFFFGQYLLAWAISQVSEDTIRVGGFSERPERFINIIRDGLKINGSPAMYANFFWFQGYMVMTLLALAGSILVGNDFHFGSLPFYLAKPLSRWHYLAGKCLAVGVFVNLMTTIPAVILFVQYGLLESWSYFVESFRVFLGILGYGLLLTVCLSLFLVATASWLRKTVPMIMIWATCFVFFRLIATTLVDRLSYSAHWRLIDIWHNAYLVGGSLLGMPRQTSPQPPVYEAGLVLGVLSLICLIYLNLRIRGVEVVR
jgi:ABC-2 type transport system permease protein